MNRDAPALLPDVLPAPPEVPRDRTSARKGTSARKLQKDAKILTLLPANLGTDVIYLKSEDHYINVRTTIGSCLVKMRFTDAVAELGDRGFQVHRSYWVATSHVQRLVRNGKRTQIRLTDGHQVPVRVTYLPTVARNRGALTPVTTADNGPFTKRISENS